VIPTEGRPANSQALEYSVGNGASFTGVELWFAWSNTVRDYMLAQGVLPGEKIVVAGVPRFDMYREPLKQLLLPRSEFARRYGFDVTEPIISWGTNFTHARYYGETQKSLAEDWRALGLLRFS